MDLILRADISYKKRRCGIVVSVVVYDSFCIIVGIAVFAQVKASVVHAMVFCCPGHMLPEVQAVSLFKGSSFGEILFYLLVDIYKTIPISQQIHMFAVNIMI